MFFLVTSSKLLRDDRWGLAMLNSWLISFTQFAFVLVVSRTNELSVTFFSAALGGSLGCAAAHLLYTRYIWRPRHG